jgi:hypothetical protein
VIGIYSLSSLSIEVKNFPEVIAKKLPRYPIPAALLGRLSVNRLAQGISCLDLNPSVTKA